MQYSEYVSHLNSTQEPDNVSTTEKAVNSMYTFNCCIFSGFIYYCYYYYYYHVGVNCTYFLISDLPIHWWELWWQRISYHANVSGFHIAWKTYGWLSVSVAQWLAIGNCNIWHQSVYLALHFQVGLKREGILFIHLFLSVWVCFLSQYRSH